MAKLHFKYGAMNSGKTDTLIKTAYNYEEQGLSVIVIKPSIDTKGDRMLVARAGVSRQASFLATPDMDLYREIKSRGDKQKLACVLIDEAQFLKPKQVDQLLKIAKKQDVSVIAYGLRDDFRIKLFPGSKRLLELADNIEKLPTMCGCGSQAEFNCRKINGEIVFSGDQVAIDGKDKVTYDSLCWNCYDKAKKAAK